MFFSTHYAGDVLGIKFSDGEPWKKVFGPVFIYLNSVPSGEGPLGLWPDAKEQVLIFQQFPTNFQTKIQLIFTILISIRC